MSEINPGAGFEDNGQAAMMIDMSGVSEDAGFACIPRGTYPAIVDEVTFGMSQSSGNPMWTWKFEISEGDFANRKLFFHTVLVPDQLPRLKKVLARVAPELLEGPFNPQEVADQGLLVGKACQVRVDVRKYEGTDRNNVRDVLPAAEGAGSDSFL